MHLPHTFANFRCDHAQVNLPVATGYWRSVGNSYNAFFVESFVDELAVALRRPGICSASNCSRRSRASPTCLMPLPVLRGGPSALPKGWGRGIALAESFKSTSARSWMSKLSARTSRSAAWSAPWIAAPRYTPDNVKRRSPARRFSAHRRVKGKITLSEGVVQQSNFNDYPLLKYGRMPDVRNGDRE